jgi:hypothetical protein
MTVCLEDFRLVNNWKVHVDGEKFNSYNQQSWIPKFIIDETTGRRYLNESPGLIRFKCFLVTSK